MTAQRTFSLEDIQDADDHNEGFCLSCGARRVCCEPDARNYRCEDCGDLEVFGAQEIVFMGLVR